MKKRRLLSLLLAAVLVFPSALSVQASAAGDSSSEFIVGNFTKNKSVKSITSFDTAYQYYTEGNPNDSWSVFQWTYDENDVAYIQLKKQTSATFEFETTDDDSEEEKVFEVTHDTCIVLREAVATKPENVKEVTVTVNTPIVVKSGHYLILRSQGTGYSNEYTTVYLNCPITVEEGATLLLDGPQIGGGSLTTGPRDIYVGPESGPAIIAEEGATVRLGGVVLQPNASNEDAFIQATSATVIVQAGNTKDTAKGTKPTGELPDVPVGNASPYHSNTYAVTSGSAPIIEASDGATVQLLGGNFVSTGDTPAITVDGSSSIKIDMENAAWTNKHGQGVEAEGEGTSAVSIASGGTLELGEYAPATASNNEIQAIDLAVGATVKKGDMEITVDDGEGDNYVDNYGNIILAANPSEDGEGTVTAAKIILADGTTIEGTEEEPLQITYDEGDSGETVTQVTVPEGGAVTPVDGEKTTWENGGSVESNGDETDTTPAVSGVTLSATTLNLVYGGEHNTETLTAGIVPEGAEGTISWNSNNENVATVDENGTVTAVGVGKATITVTVTDSEDNTLATATCMVNVSKEPVPATGITLSETSLSLREGKTAPLTATVTPADSTDSVVWSSSDESVATVDQNGVVTAVKNGSATITATANDNVSATCEVTVTKKSSSGGGGSSTPTYTVSTPSNVENGTVKVSPKSAGKGDTVTITVTPEKGYEVDEVVVTDKNGKEISVKDQGNGKYTFTMPASKVDIEVAFAEIEEQPKASFIDVPAGAYYYDAVAWAVENGITDGTTAVTFTPDAACTRAQAVTFLWRAAGSPAPRSSVNPFADVQPGAYYCDAVLWAVEQGITTGTTATTFSPNETCTRGQIVTFLYRADGTAVAGGNPFSDVADGAYYADAVAWAVESGVTSGTTATTFSPDRACTRAQIVTFLYRAEA